MRANSDVLLCSTLHDQRGVFVETIEAAARTVLENYNCWVVNVTTTTDQRVKDKLRALAPLGVVMTETDTEHKIVDDQVENDHLSLLSGVAKVSRETGTNKIQYTDGDRIIMAATYFPNDLKDMAHMASTMVDENMGYVNFRRSKEDFNAHHQPLVQTEVEINRVYTHVLGLPIDMGSTSHVMTADVVDEIARRSPDMETVSFPHPKWLIIAKEMGVKIQSAETHNVLTFETPEQFKKETESSLGGRNIPGTETDLPYRRLQKEYEVTLGLDSTLSQREWDARFKIVKQYLQILSDHMPEFKAFIGESQIKMEGMKLLIEKGLQHPEGNILKLK